MKEEEPRRKAILSQKLLALLLYTNLPPQRAKEYQSLEYKIHKKRALPPPGERNPAVSNCLHITEDGSEAYLSLTDYKTQKSHGNDYLPLLPNSPLLEHLTIHLQHHRKNLEGKKKCTNLFVSERGNPFQTSMWTAYIQGIFEHYTGHRIGPSRLRSIFTTYNERQENVSETLKVSLASCMKHSRETVSCTCTYIGLHCIYSCFYCNSSKHCAAKERLRQTNSAR